MDNWTEELFEFEGTKLNISTIHFIDALRTLPIIDSPKINTFPVVEAFRHTQSPISRYSQQQVMDTLKGLVWEVYNCSALDRTQEWYDELMVTTNLLLHTTAYLVTGTHELHLMDTDIYRRTKDVILRNKDGIKEPVEDEGYDSDFEFKKRKVDVEETETVTFATASLLFLVHTESLFHELFTQLELWIPDIEIYKCHAVGKYRVELERRIKDYSNFIFEQTAYKDMLPPMVKRCFLAENYMLYECQEFECLIWMNDKFTQIDKNTKSGIRLLNDSIVRHLKEPLDGITRCVMNGVYRNRHGEYYESLTEALISQNVERSI